MSDETVKKNRLHLLTALYLSGFFALGMLSGAAVYHWVAPAARCPKPPRPPGPPKPPGPPPPPRFAPLPLERLGLSQEQWKKVNAIVERYRPAFHTIMEETFPRVRKVTDKMEGEIKKLLTKAQRRKLDKLKAMERRNPMGPPGGPPPPHHPPGGMPPPGAHPPPPGAHAPPPGAHPPPPGAHAPPPGARAPPPGARTPPPSPRRPHAPPRS